LTTMILSSHTERKESCCYLSIDQASLLNLGNDPFGPLLRAVMEKSQDPQHEDSLHIEVLVPLVSLPNCQRTIDGSVCRRTI
jgi:hypothetical protein